MSDRAPRLPPWLPATKWQVALAALAGVLHGLSQPVVIEALGPDPIDPTGLSGLLVFVGYVPLLYVVRDTTVKRAYLLAYVFFVVKYSIILYWVTVAMTVFGKIPWAISIICLVLLAGTIAGPLSGTFAGARMLCARYGFPFWVIWPLVLGGGEVIRNDGILGGFPWGAAGYSFATIPLLLQSAAVVGVYGLALLAMYVNSGINEGLTAWMARRSGQPLEFPKRPLAVAAAIPVVMVLYGAMRMASDPTANPDGVETVKVALLQGNIEQGIKNKERQNARLILDRYHALQAEAVAAGAEIVVWPEAAVPVRLKAQATSLRDSGIVPATGPASGLVPPAGIIGATAAEYAEDPVTGKRFRKRYNTVFATDADLRVKGRFDKVHLVPFGEYVPWPFNLAVRHLVPGLTTPGDGYRAAVLEIGDRSVTTGATVCYEGLFPEITRAYVDDGAELMFNVTNDAWYGVSSAPYQHFLMYAVRAVESGRPVARAANTGLSGWVDIRGRVHDLTDLYETTYKLVEIPLVTEDTVYLRTGNKPWGLVIVGILALWFYALAGFQFWRRKRHRIEWIVGALGLSVAAWTVLSHHALFPPGLDDAASTRNQIRFCFGILVGLGALSGRPWGRWAQIVVGGTAVILGIAGAAFGAWWALAASAVGAGVAVLAFRRKDAYREPPPVDVAGPYAET